MADNRSPAFLPSQRHLFDIPAGLAYFNAAYYAPQLNSSRERLVQAVAAKSHPWERTPPDFFADANSIRQLAASIAGGDGDGYAVVPSVSYGIATAAQALRPTLESHHRIVVLDEEFPSNYYSWVRIAADAGATVDVVPRPANGDWTAAILTRLDRNVRVAAIPTCHWTNGAVVDLEAVARACRAIGAALVVDGTQSIGAMRFDMDAVRPDFLVAAGYKWLLSPYGTGVMYVAPQWRTARPLEESWMTRLGAEDFAGLTRYRQEYLPGARRFDVGETTTALLPGAVAALEQIVEWTVAGISRRLAGINAQIGDFLQENGFTCAEPRLRSPHMIGAGLPKSFEGDFVGALRARRVYISQRGNSLRFAPHVHVTDSDVTQLLNAVEEVLRGG